MGSIPSEASSATPKHLLSLRFPAAETGPFATPAERCGNPFPFHPPRSGQGTARAICIKRLATGRWRPRQSCQIEGGTPVVQEVDAKVRGFMAPLISLGIPPSSPHPKWR